MPENINYKQLKNTLSASRIGTYRRCFPGHTEQEIYGVYLWNMALCGAIYPLLQSAEVALRNAISTAAVEAYGDYWHEKIPHAKDKKTGKDNDAYIKLRDAFKAAEKFVVKNENARRISRGAKPHSESYRPDFNKVIAQTNFAVWENSLHPSFYQIGSGFLWPKHSKKAFKNWPHQSSKVTHTKLYDLVSEIRPFRNRLSHHEPLWKEKGEIGEKSALKYINNKIDKIEELIRIISTEKHQFLQVQRLIDKARSMATVESLDYYRYRQKPAQFYLKRKSRVRKFLKDSHQKNGPTIFTYADCKFKIESA